MSSAAIDVKVKRVSVRDYESCVGCGMCMLACSRRLGVLGFSKSAIVVRSFGGFERGFVIVFCRLCYDPPCVRVCPTKAIEKRSGKIVVEYSKCIGCKLCIEVCTVGAVQWDEEVRKPIICSHCAYCTYFCPHGVLVVEEVSAA